MPMEKGIIPKFATIMVCIVVAVTVIMTALVPIISDQTTKTELVNNPDAYGPSVGYVGDVAPASSNITYFSMKYTPTTEYFEIYTTAADGSTTFLIRNVTRDTIPDKAILYGDNNATIYIDDMTVYVDLLDDSEEDKSYDLTSNPGNIFARYKNAQYQYGNSMDFAYLSTPISYYYMAYMDGDYSNCLGDNPPTMDTPSVSVAGMYIGPKMTERTVPNDLFTGSVVLTIIPIIMLVSLVMLCIREFMRTRE